MVVAGVGGRSSIAPLADPRPLGLQHHRRHLRPPLPADARAGRIPHGGGHEGHRDRLIRVVRQVVQAASEAPPGVPEGLFRARIGGRGAAIRTRDLLNPIQVRYQAAPHPDRSKDTRGARPFRAAVDGSTGGSAVNRSGRTGAGRRVGPPATFDVWMERPRQAPSVDPGDREAGTGTAARAARADGGGLSGGGQGRQPWSVTPASHHGAAAPRPGCGTPAGSGCP